MAAARVPFLAAGALAMLSGLGSAKTAGETAFPFAVRVAPSDEETFGSPAGHMPGAGVPLEIHWKGPSKPERLDVLQGRRDLFPRWQWIGRVAASDGSATLRAQPGLETLLVWRPSDGGDGRYRISEPFFWPEAAASRGVVRRAARTLAGPAAPIGPGGSLRLAPDPSVDPLCENDRGERWQCPGVPASFEGVVLLCAPAERRFAPVRPDRPDTIRFEGGGAGWSAVVSLDPDAEPAAPRADPAAAPAFRLESPANAGGQTLERTPLVPIRLASSSYFLSGRLAPESRIAVRLGRRAGAISLDEVLAAGCGGETRIPLTEARSLRGRVTDGEGHPRARASVLALEPSRDRSKPDAVSGPVFLDSTLADDQGAWSFAELDPRARLIRVCHAGAGCADEDVPSFPFSGSLDIALRPKWRFTGRVVSRTGVPQPAAHLRFLPTIEQYERAGDRLLLIPPESDAESDPSGRFEIAPPAPGKYFLEARASSLGTARLTVTVAEAGPSKTDLGDLVLSGAGEFLARVQGAGCVEGTLIFAGPIGPSSLPTLVQNRIEPGGLARVALPEGGEWLVWARCADGRRAVSPGSFSNVEDLYDREITVAIDPLGADEPAREDDPSEP